MASSSPSPVTVVLSKCMVKPAFMSEESRKPHFLTPWDLQSLNYEYILLGLLFNKPGDGQSMEVIIDRLKKSLAVTLTHFTPFSARFKTENIQDPPSYCVYVDCKDPAGAEFLHAASNVSISDILSPSDVPQEIIESLFPLAPGAPNYLGHTFPLLVVQVTELVDGIFIAFTANHALVDGTSFWHFINSYSEVCRSSEQQFTISRPPVINSWFLNDRIHTPGRHPKPNEGGSITPPQGTFRHKIFHLTSKAVRHLKTKANNEYHTCNISTYQALAALIWRSVTRARGLLGHQLTTCAVPVNCRSKLEPPLSDVYFGSCFMMEFVSSTVDELLSNNLGWAAGKLNETLTKFDNHKVRSFLDQFGTADCTMAVGDPGFVFLGNSPQFNVYGNDFGWGNPLALRWSGDVVDGIVNIVPGCDSGSVDLMVGLSSKFMSVLELDDEFMGALSFHPLSKF